MILANKSKLMGKKAGVSDLVVFTKKNILFIEMKRQRKILKNGNKSKEVLTSEAQRDFLAMVYQYDYAKSFVAYGWLEAKRFIELNIKGK